MNLIARLLPLEKIHVDLAVSSKKRLFEQFGLLFENHNSIAQSLVYESLFVRERLGTTALGHGVAMPHGRIKGLREATGALIRLATPIPFDAPDGQPVRLAFALLVPERATEKHLQILSALAQLFSDRERRESMLSAPDASALHQLMTTWHNSDASTQRQAVA
jgi:PTS system nitrogen regulatory IIA component